LTANLLKALIELEKEKGIKKEELMEAVKLALVTAFKKNFGEHQNILVEIEESGQIKAFIQKEVAIRKSKKRGTISLKEARQIKPECKLGDAINVEINSEKFGRIAAQTVRQVISQKVKEAEKDLLYKEFLEKKGDIITGNIFRIEKGRVYVDLGKLEGVIPPSEQSPNDNFRVGDRVRAYVLDVKERGKDIEVILSRTHPEFVVKLFQLEVPELYEGIVTIKAFAREPGYRTKIAVHSDQKNIDSIGACVGNKGVRVLAIVNELNEKIDVIEWSENASKFIANALSPAKVTLVKLNEPEKTALAIVPPDQLSLAIGREGLNAKLAAKLTGWKIDIKNENLIENEEQNKEA